jgi:hypothetical protein
MDRENRQFDQVAPLNTSTSNGSAQAIAQDRARLVDSLGGVAVDAHLSVIEGAEAATILAHIHGMG